MKLPTSSRSRRPSACPRLEALEDRVVPAVSLDFADVLTYPELINSSTTTQYRLHGVDQAFDSTGNRYVLLNVRDAVDASINPQAFLARFTPDDALDTTFDGDGLLSFSGLPGLPDYTRGHGLVIDAADNVYVAVNTSPNLDRGSIDILKLDTAGAVLQSYHEGLFGDPELTGGNFDFATDAGFVYYTNPVSGTVKLESTATGLVERARYSVGAGALAVDPANGHVYLFSQFGGKRDFDPYNTYADNRDILDTGKSRFGHAPPEDVFLLELNQTSSGGLAFAWVGKYDIGGAGDVARDVALDSTGLYLYSTGHTGTGKGMLSLTKVANSGSATGHPVEWVTQMPVDGSTQGNTITLDGAGGVYVLSSVGSGIDLQAGANYAGDTISFGGNSNIFLAAYSSTGSFRWAATIAQPRAMQAFGIDRTGNGEVRIATTAIVYSSVSTFTFNTNGNETQQTADNGSLVIASYADTLPDAPLVYVNDITKAEGNSGTTTFQFEVRLTAASSDTVTVAYSTGDGTAVAGTDYTAASGTVTFAIGEMSKTVTVNVKGDTTGEADETFYLDLAVSGTDVVNGSTRVTATIVNDDKGGGKRLVAASAGTSTGLAPMSAAQIQPLWRQALARWAAAGADTAKLANVSVRVRDLGGLTLGMVSGNTVWIDDNAAGWGWFVDATPGDDREFRLAGNQGEQGRMDLLSVLMHEAGHLLGHGHDGEGVMRETLAAGTRLSPEGPEPLGVADPADLLFALLAAEKAGQRLHR